MAFAAPGLEVRIGANMDGRRVLPVLGLEGGCLLRAGGRSGLVMMVSLSTGKARDLWGRVEQGLLVVGLASPLLSQPFCTDPRAAWPTW